MTKTKASLSFTFFIIKQQTSFSQINKFADTLCTATNHNCQKPKTKVKSLKICLLRSLLCLLSIVFPHEQQVLKATTATAI